MAGSIIGVETAHKPFPSIVHENQHLFKGVKSVLDIGAGTGRFVKYLLLGRYTNGGKVWELRGKPDIVTYVAIEPYQPSCRKLWELRDSRLQVICDTWESVRDKLAGSRFDVVILWDVAMFMDLRPIYGTSDPVEALIRELDIIINMVERLFLFSLHPVKNCIICQNSFNEILSYLDNHAKLKLIGKKYLNRVYAIRG